MNRARRPRVLSIAGTDPSGGAGHAADLKAIAAMGGYGMSVITAVVAQNTAGVREILTIPAEMIRAQLEAVCDDVAVDAIKVGMLGSRESIDVVSEVLRDYRAAREAAGAPRPLLLIDPVMVSSSGHRLLDLDCEQALRGLLREADLITPNAEELAVLVGEPAPVDHAAAFDFGARVARDLNVAVLVKGGHVTGQRCIDTILAPAAGIPQVIAAVDSPRQHTRVGHGTGCSMASALATLLVRTDRDFARSLAVVHQWLQGAIAAGEDLGVGTSGENLPVDHLAGTVAYPDTLHHQP